MRNFRNNLSALLVVVLALTSCQKEEISSEPMNMEVLEDVEVISYQEGITIPGQYIVVLNDQSLPGFKKSMGFSEGKVFMEKYATDLLETHSIKEREIIQSFAHTLKGFVVQLSDAEVDVLTKDERIEYVEEDQIISLKRPDKGGGSNGGGADPQVIPWGITAVGGFGNGAATGKKAWIIDSGIDLTHPDLNVDVSNSMSFLSGNQSTNPSDQNGHGTHVAGTIGALNNSIGVVGVAAGVPVVAVRVLDRRGSGAISGVIAGVNYVAANANSGDVANMSLGGGVSTTLDNAVIAAANLGIKFSIAAGNSSTSATTSSPARVNGNNIYTISAMNSSGFWASFSNYGNPPIDFCAPGVNIQSTYKNGGYSNLSGTSMAAPHVAGILVLGNVVGLGTVSGDPDGTPDSKAHR